MTNPSCPWWKSPKYIAILIILAALGLYLIIVHQQHVLGALPFLLILLCPLSHLFMHGGHHGKTGDDGKTHDHEKGCH